MIDAVKRGRHGTARLNIDQVRDIRRLRGSSYAWVDADEPSTTEPPPPT